MSLTTEQIKKLAAPLDAGRVKTRQGGNGGNLSYLETHDVIRAANNIFGFGKWGHRITRLEPLGQIVVHNRDNKPGVHLGYLCAVELTVEGCQPVSGVGYGDATEYRESAAVTAHELAAKEAESDALKRALKNYGDQFGLVLYDKYAAGSEHLNGASPNGGGATSTPPSRPAATTTSAPTEKQIQFLERLMRERGITDLGKPVDQLSKQEASQFIEQLKAGTFQAPGEAALLAELEDLPF